MSLLGFVRQLLRPGTRRPPRQAGHELADHVRDTMGPQGGGSGRAGGRPAFRYLEGTAPHQEAERRRQHRDRES